MRGAAALYLAAGCERPAVLHQLADGALVRNFRLNSSEPGKSDPEVPNPSLPPDMEPVVPQQDPPQPGRPGDGEPPAVIA